ncbi:uncharacterized protein CCR75_009359 [Bremia lactucae]|uniref:Uncharacterized protein n=1 Tax=Bremia lactucae TaxID=4779 RepID=A0A976FNB2_BRELC|nr:hypothetical protein CCR75_009359 [Bremia lactucae]
MLEEGKDNASPGQSHALLASQQLKIHSFATLTELIFSRLSSILFTSVFVVISCAIGDKDHMAARNLVRFLKSAEVSFSSFDRQATGACEFYRQLVAEKTRRVNPKAKITHQTSLTGCLPTIKLEFINGSLHMMEVPNKNVREIFEDVDFHCSQIETEYEQEGKIIE